MLTQICQYLRNWFNGNQPKIVGDFVVTDGEIETTGSMVRLSDVLQEGQYFCVVGSALNDGVYLWPETGLNDERFHGAVWPMAVPQVILDLASDIEAWADRYTGYDSAAMSPFQSESFGGYSYSKGAGDGGGAAVTWQSAFADRLSPWRKI